MIPPIGTWLANPSTTSGTFSRKTREHRCFRRAGLDSVHADAVLGQFQRQIAMMRASVTSCAVIYAFIAQPATRRENTADDGGRVKSSFDGPDVGSVGDPLLVRYRCLEGAVEEVVGHHGSLACVLRQPAAPRPGTQPVLPDEPLDAIQAAGPVKHPISVSTKRQQAILRNILATLPDTLDTLNSAGRRLR